jgi:hypothetical protein
MEQEPMAAARRKQLCVRREVAIDRQPRDAGLVARRRLSLSRRCLRV